MSNSIHQLSPRIRFIAFSSLVLFSVLCAALILRPVLAAISISASTPYVQNFDAIGTSATATLPTDWRLDRPSTVRTVGNFATATSNTTQVGGANLSTSASNGAYNFGSGTTTTGPDRAVGFLSSGTATQSGNLYAQLVNNTGGNFSGLQISYDVEKYRNGSNGAGFGIQMFYSTDGSTWTSAGSDFLTSFAADANNNGFATAPGATVSISNKTLNASVANGANIYLAWNYSVASGSTTTNAQALAIDNVSIRGIAAAGPTNPTGTGASSPNSVIADGTTTTLLTVAVTAGANPTSTGLGVTANLTAIGGAASQQFFDDGTHGDVTAGDNVFSFRTTVATGTSGGSKSMAATITDAQSRTGSATIPLNVLASTPPSGTGSASPNPVPAGNSSLLTVTVTPGTNPTSTALAVRADLSSIGGSATQSLFDDGTHGDGTAGDNTFSFQATVSSGTSAGIKTLPVTITDAQSRSGTTSISLSIQAAPTPPGAVVISQIYGGGGNAGATYKNDFIEIFNRSSNPVDLTGWTVQYLSATGTGNWSGKTSLSGTIPAGGYYLVQEGAGSGGTVNLPTPDAIGTIAMALGAGRVALVNNSTTLNGCPTSSNIIDLVGYGSTAICYEGSPTPDLGNTLAAFRTHLGCRDTDDNSKEFKVAPPSPRNSSTSLHVCSQGDLEPEVFSTTPADSATSIPLSSNITVQFDEPINVSGAWFGISCSLSGAHNATVTGGPTTFTINPDMDFMTLEQCTVTIYASNVTDQDAIDPPDNMAADYSWSFLTGHDPQVNLTMGNPSNATADESNENNYLMEKDQYSLSYNRSKATANWVSWQLDQTWLGSTPRQDTFRADDTLPAAWYHVLETDYQFGTYGFDRGHMCPSADRTATIADNSNTFLMTNMVPQASGNNQGPWGALENYLRTQISGGANRLYIISGPAGVGGNSSTGHWDAINTPTSGVITVPSSTWKVALVMPTGDNDVSRVNNSTRTIAVIMPNNDNIRPDDWKKYLATVRQVESLSGYNFYSNVPQSIQDVIEPRLDAVNDTAPQVTNQAATTDEDNAVTFTLTATDFNINNVLSFSAASGPAHGALQFGMPNCPANLSQAQCTVAVTYTPAANYNGPDSFTFTANDGALGSNTATVSITVNPVNDAPTANHQSVTTNSNNSIAITLTGSDVETAPSSLVFAVTSGTGSGSLSGTAPNLVYTPNHDFCGSDSLRFTVTDTGDGSSGALTSSEGTVSITVKDTVAPTITTPADMTVIAASGADSAVVNFTVTASDSCGGVNVVSTPASGSVFPLGTTTVHITATDDAGNIATSTFNVTVKATSTVNFNCPASAAFTGSALEPCTATVTGAGGLNQPLTVSYANNVNAGTANASASYAGDPTHEGSSGSANFEITKASSTITVNCPASETYTGNPIEPCTATVTGAGGLNQLLGVSYTDNTNAGTASAGASYGGDSNHEGSTGGATFTIAKASSTTAVNCPPSQTYTGAAIEPCTASYSGVGGLSGTLTPTYSDNTNAGTATANASYGGNANHEGSSNSSTFEITKASSTTTVTCTGSPVYTGFPITPCSVTVTGANLSLTPDPAYTNNVDAGANTARASYTFDGDANHTGSSDSKTFSIAQANATINVSGYSGVYDGGAHGATGSATGVNGENLSGLLNLGASFTNVPGGTAHWTFAGNTNYASSGGDVSITITKVTPTINWNNPADITYGTALSPTQLNATANVAGTFSYTPASGTIVNAGPSQPLLASFTPSDAANYNATSKNVLINVLKATPSFSNLSSPVIAYGTATTNLSGKLSYGSFVPTGNVAITLNGVTQSAAIQAGGNFSSGFATGSLAPTNPPYTINYSYAGDGNFNAASGSGTLTVGYGILPLYDQTKVHQSGSTVPIKLAVINSSGANISSANLTVTAIGVSLISTNVYGPVSDSGNSNPDNNFRFTNDSYTFNLKTTGLSTGVYNLYFTVGTDPTLHTVQFQIK